MEKKYVLAAAMAAFFATANIVEAPIRSLAPSPIERTIIEKEAFGKSGKEIEKKLDNLIDEMKLAHNDWVYNVIGNVYRNLGLDIPDYITKRLLREVAKIESEDYPKAVGKDGERGLMQLMKETWYLVDNENFEKNAFIPEKNIRNSLIYLLMKDSDLRANYPNWEKFSDSKKIEMLIASYNGGFGYLMEKKGDISKMKPITKNYVKKIKNNMNFILSDYDYQSKKL